MSYLPTLQWRISDALWNDWKVKQVKMNRWVNFVNTNDTFKTVSKITDLFAEYIQAPFKVQCKNDTCNQLCLWQCTASLHNTTQNSSDSLPCYRQTSVTDHPSALEVCSWWGAIQIHVYHSSDVVYRGPQQGKMTDVCLKTLDRKNGRYVLPDVLVNRRTKVWLASCLTNAQPLPAHRPAADDNSLIGCTSHELTDDWSLASTHFVDS